MALDGGMHMTVKVIGAGFGRTGTDSLREALTILGLGPCHHMFEVNAHERQRALCRALVLGAAPDWDQLLEGYTACVDWPSAYYWRELMAAFPDAKIILTYRSPESWWESFEKTILDYIQTKAAPDSLVNTLIARKVFGGRPGDRAHAIEVYEANTRDVIASVPSDRLLVHNVGDGWERLCPFLGVTEPAEAYPNRNSAAAIRERYKAN